MAKRSLIQGLALWLTDLKACEGCTGVFQKVNNLDPSLLCDRCLRGVLSQRDEQANVEPNSRNTGDRRDSCHVRDRYSTRTNGRGLGN